MPVKNKVLEEAYVLAIPTKTPSLLSPTVTVANPTRSLSILAIYNSWFVASVDVPPPSFWTLIPDPILVE